MSDRTVVLRAGQPRQFLVDVCGVLADEVNEPDWTLADKDLVVVYAEAVVALARLRRQELEALGGSDVQVAIIDHLMERVCQARAGEIEFRLADVVDRLHAESISELISA